ncbi:MAG: hypothetical protein AAF634_00575 [Bacteroidota bacterium]
MRWVSFLCLVFFPILLLGQQNLSKKALREQRKAEKTLKRHQLLVVAAKDTSFALHIPSMSRVAQYGDDKGILTFEKTGLTLYNVIMPVTDDEIKEKIPSYITPILAYAVTESPSGDLTITSRFQYSKWEYELVIAKSQMNNLAVAQFYVRGGLLDTYEGKIRP